MKNLQNKAKAAGNKIMEAVKTFWNDESGMGTVEVILIIVEIYTMYKSVFSVFNNKNIGIFSTENTLSND